MKKIILVFFLFITTHTVFAQDSSVLNSKQSRRYEKKLKAIAMSRQEEEGVLAYNKQTALGLQLRTNGYGLFFELGRMKTPRYSNLYVFELTEIKHSKEEKYPGSENFFGNAYIFGKVNNFYQAKFGYGKQYIFGQKGNKNGVAVMGIYQGGLSLGLVKPYYIDVQNSSGDRVAIKYSDDSTLFLNPANIYGGSGFTKGWSNLSVVPGAYFKTALRFDFGRYNESVQALEIGISVDAYSKKIEQLAFTTAKQLFYQGHIAFVFGHRK